MDETSSLQRLSHRNLIQIFAKGATTKGDHIYPWYIMDYVKDVSDSEKFLAKEGGSQEDLIQVFEGVVSAVHYLHEQGTIHMDIKPGNILITPEGIPVIFRISVSQRASSRQCLHSYWCGETKLCNRRSPKFIEEVQSDPRRLESKRLIV